MNTNPVTIVVTPYIEDGQIKNRLSRERVLNRKPFFGDFFVRTDELDFNKCIFSINRYDRKNKDHKHICNTILHQEDGKMIRIRMGESLVISNISSTKHIQFMMVEDRYNLGQAKFIRLYNNSINQDKLESSRKFSQRQDAKLRKQSFHLNTQLEPKLHDFTLPIRKVRDAQKNRPSWWKRIMNFITGNAA